MKQKNMKKLIIRTIINGKDKDTDTIGAYDDVTVSINHVVSLINDIALKDMDGKKYAFYIVEPITETVIRRFFIEP